MAGEASDACNRSFRRGIDDGTRVQGDRRNTGSPRWLAHGGRKPEIREGRTGLLRMADGLVVPVKPGNAGGGKEPELKANARRGEEPGDWINDPRTS
jgi:hypothetical protein